MGRIIQIDAGLEEAYLKASPGIYKPDFQIMTAGLWPDQNDSRLVHTIGSSTEQDLQGDYMSLEALNSMTKMPPNVTTWLNHSYTLPDDIFGSVKGTPKILHADGIADLHLDMDVEFDNPAAARVKKYIDNGRRLGCSIGCLVTKYEVPDEADGGEWFMQPIIIHGVRVLEFSIVGIPANQRAWVTNAVRGVFTRTFDPRLAPAMKSLWPRQYEELLTSAAESVDPAHFQKLLNAPVRPSSDVKLLWHTPTHKFMIARGKSEQEIETADIKAMTEMGAKARLEYAERVAGKSGGVVSPVVDEDFEAKDLAEIETAVVTPASVETASSAPEEIKTACGSTSFPLNKERSWDKGSAHGRLLEWAGGKDSFSAAKFKRVHFRYTGSGDKITDFHFPFCDIVDGKVEAIWHAVTAAASALGGARGGADHEGDEDAMRSKIAHYYRKAGETPPWEDGEKGIEAMHIIGFALNEDGTPGIALKDGGNHEPTVGVHRHHHEAHGHGNLDQHHHTHSHDNDNVHHHTHDGLTESEYPQSTHDETTDDDGDQHKSSEVQLTGAVPLAQLEEAINQAAQSGEPVVHTLSADQQAHLSTLNTIGRLLGLPEITAEHVVKQTLPVQKEGTLTGEHLAHAKAIHDHLYQMTNGVVCSNEMSMQDAQNDAAMAEGRDMSDGALRGLGTLSASMGALTKALEAMGVTELQQDAAAVRTKIATAQGELERLHADIRAAQESIAALKNMPLGNPVNHSRTVQSEVSHGDLLRVQESRVGESVTTLSASLGQTQIRTVKMTNGQQVSYRHWPAGVGKGVRPALTTNQIMFMHDLDISSYRDDGEANVPMIDDPQG